MMSWIRESEKKPWYHRALIRLLKAGPVPQHIAFIMDGNRRFARKNSMERAEGHLMGFDKLAQTLEWCLDLGVTEVTVYAFSIENFKRSKEEVDCLMEIARQKFEKLLEEKDMLEKHGVCIRVLGNLTLLPADVQAAIAEAVTLTMHNDRATLNVCLSYTSRDEMCTAMQEMAEGVQLGLINQCDINESLLSKCLYTRNDPDLLLRTSGEVRLSDFLLWQSSYSVLSFMPVLWPDFSVWHLYAGVLHYQSNYQAVQDAREASLKEEEQRLEESDRQCVLDQVAQKKINGRCLDDINMPQLMQEYALQREGRTNTFLAHVWAKRDSFLNEICERSRTCKVRES